MAREKQLAAPLGPLFRENQRRFFLEMLRANLHAKTSAAMKASCEQERSPMSAAPTHKTGGLIPPDLPVVSKALGGQGVLGGMKTNKTENGLHAAGSASCCMQTSGKEGGSNATKIARKTIHEMDNIQRAGSIAADSTCSAAPSDTSPPEKGGPSQRELSAALFTRLAEALPKEQGPLNFITWEDGSWYCGHLVGGSLHGIGVFKYADDSVYCGQWDRDRLQGYGAFIAPNGFLFRGHFHDSKQNGPGIFLVPQGPTFFGNFNEGRLDGFSCMVSPSSTFPTLLGEWKQGEFVRAFPLHGHLADFYVWASQALDLLESAWRPLPVPMPDAPSLDILKELPTSTQFNNSSHSLKLCNAQVLRALNTELPLLGASPSDEGISPPAERFSSKRISASNGRSLVRKRKGGLLKLHGNKESKQQQQQQLHAAGGAGVPPGADPKARGPQTDSGGVPSGPPRATTTKAQLLRWESEARKLPRIPHLNYNRVLGRWYARVRDPASGRRIWKGYTCAVHGFLQARDMAIDRLRQFSQLLSPVASNTETSMEAGATVHAENPVGIANSEKRDKSDYFDSKRCLLISQSQRDDPIIDLELTSKCRPTLNIHTNLKDDAVKESTPPIPPAAAVAAAATCCSKSDASGIRDAAAASAFQDATAIAAAAAAAASGSLGVSVSKGHSVSKHKGEQEDVTAAKHLDMPCREDNGILPGSVQTPLHAAAGICEETTADPLSAGPSSELSFDMESAAAPSYKPDVGFADSISCSRLTTADCSDASRTRSTLTSYEGGT